MTRHSTLGLRAIQLLFVCALRRFLLGYFVLDVLLEQMGIGSHEPAAVYEDGGRAVLVDAEQIASRTAICAITDRRIKPPAPHDLGDSNQRPSGRQQTVAP